VDREAFDQINGLIALPLQKAAIDRETLSTSGVKDEVSRTGDRPAGAERLIEERRGRQLVMGRKTQATALDASSSLESSSRWDMIGWRGKLGRQLTLGLGERSVETVRN
jgi:hypothetical protein